MRASSPWLVPDPQPAEAADRTDDDGAGKEGPPASRRGIAFYRVAEDTIVRCSQQAAPFVEHSPDGAARQSGSQPTPSLAISTDGDTVKHGRRDHPLVSCRHTDDMDCAASMGGQPLIEYIPARAVENLDSLAHGCREESLPVG